MIVQCPECKTKYRLDDSRLKPGVKLKCTRCENIFFPDLSEVDQKEQVLPEESSAFDEHVKTSEEKIEKGKSDMPESEESTEQQATQQEEQDSRVIESEDKGVSSDLTLDLGRDENTGTKKKGKNKGIKVFLIIFLILLLFGGGGFAVYYFYPEVIQYIPGLDKIKQDEEKEKQKEKIDVEKVKSISLEDVRQYFVTNEKIGNLFVVEGKAVNRFNKPKELIKLRATLYDDKGNVFKTREFYCGNTVSLFQLQVLTQEELEASLNAKLGILTNNTFIKPGGSTPFMVVFYAPPENVQEFGLEVIDVKDPPKK